MPQSIILLDYILSMFYNHTGKRQEVLACQSLHITRCHMKFDDLALPAINTFQIIKLATIRHRYINHRPVAL